MEHGVRVRYVAHGLLLSVFTDIWGCKDPFV